MPPGTGAVAVRDRTFLGVDTQSVLSVYAWVALATGLSITGTGIRGLPGVEQPHASLIWIAGMVVVAAGCTAYGLALNGDPVARRRALRAFATGHLSLGMFVWFQSADPRGQRVVEAAGGKPRARGSAGAEARRDFARRPGVRRSRPRRGDVRT